MSSTNVWSSWNPVDPRPADPADIIHADDANVATENSGPAEGNGWSNDVRQESSDNREVSGSGENAGQGQSWGDWGGRHWGDWQDRRGQADGGTERRQSDASASDSTTPSTTAERQPGQWSRPTWSEEDWKRWNSWWENSGSSSRATGGDGSGTTSTTAWSTWASTTRTGGTTTTRPSTAPTRESDEVWQPHERGSGGGKGPSEKLIIPTFNGEGEDGDLGMSARSYLRQIAAWEKMTKLAKDQRALVLYQNLQGSAWVNAESLSVELLGQADGVQYLRDWIEQHYLDVEATLVGRSLSDLFRKLKRRPAQSFRDYAAEFNRLLARVDRANLDEATEVSLLASVGNKYALKALQAAAIILDRSMRKPWEKGGRYENNRRTHVVNQTEAAEHGDSEDGKELEPPDGDFGSEDEDLYVTYMTAKARYKDFTKARGIEQGEGNNGKKLAEDRIKAAKMKSHCSACGQRGHWHRDAVCPKRKAATGGNDNQVQTIHVTNEICELSAVNLAELPAVLDTACSKTVVGTGWLQRYLDYIKGKGLDPGFVYEKDAFRFGAAHKIYEANYSAIILMAIGGKWVAVKAAVIHGDIPLLMSRPALARLGLVMDLGKNVADFRAVSSGEFDLKATPSGHPAICVDHRGLAKPNVTELPKVWENRGISILNVREVYMVGTSMPDQGYVASMGSEEHAARVFYEKQLDPAIKNLLTADSLHSDSFLAWWKNTSLTSDFWIETPNTLVRVHLVPRRALSDPRKWQTKHTLQKESLLQVLGSLRETWGISCLNERALSTVSDLWQSVADGSYPTLWVGRSVFNRVSRSIGLPLPLSGDHEQAAGSMEHEQDPVVSGVLPPRHPDQSDLDRVGASPSSLQRTAGPPEPQANNRQGPGEDDSQGAPGGGGRDGPPLWREGEQGFPDVADQRCPRSGPDCYDSGTLQGQQVHRHPRVMAIGRPKRRERTATTCTRT